VYTEIHSTICAMHFLTLTAALCIVFFIWHFFKYFRLLFVWYIVTKRYCTVSQLFYTNWNVLFVSRSVEHRKQQQHKHRLTFTDRIVRCIGWTAARTTNDFFCLNNGDGTMLQQQRWQKKMNLNHANWVKFVKKFVEVEKTEHSKCKSGIYQSTFRSF
jgi:hypothetical protein